jgi:hypothetical protein
MGMIKTLRTATVGLLLACLLAACGGGGGSGSATTAPGGGTGSSPAPVKALQLLSSSVPDGSQYVPVTTAFTLQFSAPLSTAGIQSDHIQLSDGSTTIPLNMNVSGSTLTLTLAPSNQLRAGADYKLTIKAGLTATDGSVLNSDYIFRFKTFAAEYELQKLTPADNSVHGSSMPRIIIADINGDGRADLVELAALYRPELIGNGYTLNIYAQNANNGFEKIQKLEFVADQLGYSKYFNNLFALDVDGDGKLELLVPEFREGDEASNGIRVFKADANGQFAASSFITTNYTATLDAFDVDGDGKLDLVGSNRRAIDQVTGGFQVLLHTPTGFTKLAPITLPDSNYEFGVADLDQDGKRELIVNRFFPSTMIGQSQNELLVYSQAQAGVFSLNAGLAAETSGFCSKADYCSGMKIVDWNNDGKPLLVFVAETSKNTATKQWLYAFSRKAGGGLASVFETPLGSRLYGIRDMNGDGVADLVLTGSDFGVRSEYFVVVRGKRDFSTEPYSIVYIPTDTMYPENIAIGDVNGDGRLDIVFDSYNMGILMARRTAF